MKSRVVAAPSNPPHCGGWYIHHHWGTDWVQDWATAIDSANLYARLSWEMR